MPNSDGLLLSIPVALTELAPGVVLVELARDKPYGCSLILELRLEDDEGEDWQR